MDDAVAQPAMPFRFEGGRIPDGLLPGFASEIVAGSRHFLGYKGEDLNGALAVVERSDQGLRNGERAVAGFCVAPSFEIVGGVDGPGALLRGLVRIKGMSDGCRNLREKFGEGEI